MRISPRRALPILTLVLALTVTGCYQTANDAVAPTLVDLTAIAPAPQATPTAFVTPLPASGFVAPTDNPNAQVPPSATPGESAPTSEPMTVPSQQPQQPGQAQQPQQATDAGQASQPNQPIQVVQPTQPVAPTAVLATPTALPTEGPCVHTVQPGEWFYSIARKYNITPADLMAANPRSNPDALQPGDVLNIPNCNKATATPAVSPTNTPQSLLPPPTTNPNAPTPIQLSGRTYAVANGDTLGGIARKFNVTVQALKAANGLTNDFLSVGQILKIPAPAQ